MPGDDAVPVTNMLLYLVIATVPTAACWAVLRLPRLIRRFRRSRATATNLPIERIAADLRRVHRVLTAYGPGTPMVRRMGTLQAYDALLMQACRAVDVPHRLDAVGLGTPLEIERLRVEQSLMSAGLVIR
ncbi:hypothetical protein KIPE111705_27265 [Kibdelosporangium persicum]|uniref:hypothetical protein n=1 Tax=Kibdelosporangium persicum TaxID=2698649 RepID=UPI001565731C|nr:hypothetical protein [Kibdelosporangium persicum]